MTKRHPSAAKWARWPATPDIDEIKSIGYREHLRAWHQGRPPLPVYRANLDDRATPTISDCRKLYKDSLVREDALESTLIYALKRIKALEERKVPEYKGVWKRDEEYDDSALVTHDGSMWIARAQSKGVRPGDGSLWTLCVKRGRNGRTQQND